MGILRPLVALGTPLSGIPKPWLHFKVPAIIVSAADILQNRSAQKAIESKGLHDYMDFDGAIYLDSGGYQLMTGGLTISVRDIQRLYSSVEANYYFSLDLPSFPSDGPTLRRKKRRRTFSNYEYLSRFFDKLIPVVHPPTSIARRMYYKYRDEGNPEIVSVGGLVPLMLTRRGTEHSRKEVVDIIFAMRSLHQMVLHVLGLGSPSLVPALRELRVDSTDSASWRVAAAFGMIVIPVRGQRHIGARKIRFGRYELSEEEKNIVENLKCPLLSDFGWETLEKSFRARALFNAWMTIHLSEMQIPEVGNPLNLIHQYAIEASGRRLSVQRP